MLEGGPRQGLKRPFCWGPRKYKHAPGEGAPRTRSVEQHLLYMGRAGCLPRSSAAARPVHEPEENCGSSTDTDRRSHPKVEKLSCHAFLAQPGLAHASRSIKLLLHPLFAQLLLLCLLILVAIVVDDLSE